MHSKATFTAAASVLFPRILTRTTAPFTTSTFPVTNCDVHLYFLLEVGTEGVCDAPPYFTSLGLFLKDRIVTKSSFSSSDHLRLQII